MASEAAVRTEGVGKVFGEGHTAVVAVRDVSLSIGRGELAALLGPSGSGKSTLLNAIGLVEPPTEGKIWIGDRLVCDGPRVQVSARVFRRRQIGFVFQRSNLIPFLNARENVEIAMHLNGVSGRRATRRAEELLAGLDVLERARNMPSELSGGEQQRIAVARALANQPSLVLADEPTAALDSVRGRQVMELFEQVAHEHRSGVIVVTHDHRALDVFDTLYEMQDGAVRRGERSVGDRPAARGHA